MPNVAVQVARDAPPAPVRSRRDLRRRRARVRCGHRSGLRHQLLDRRLPVLLASEGHTATKVCCSSFQSAYSTFDTFSTIRLILTTAGGRWLASDIVHYGGISHFSSPNNDDKLGCFNLNAGTMWVNCRRYSGWGNP